jgi:hypothetical protein
MSALFDDLLAVEGVKGVMFFSDAGELLFEESGTGGMDKAAVQDWQALLVSIDGAREAGGDDGAHRPGRHDPFELRRSALGIEKPQARRPAFRWPETQAQEGSGTVLSTAGTL